jgi:hypothetical protein
MYCLCVNVYCHRVTTQLQLRIISYQDNRILVFCVVREVHKFDDLTMGDQWKKRDDVRKTGIFDKIFVISHERRD